MKSKFQKLKEFKDPALVSQMNDHFSHATETMTKSQAMKRLEEMSDEGSKMMVQHNDFQLPFSVKQ